MQKEKKNPAIMVIVLGFLLLSTNLFSQEADSLKSYKTDDIVVTATRSAKSLINIGRSATLITKEDLNNSIYLSPSELLTNQEGISIIGSGQTPGSLQSIYMRGASSNQTVIMIDGIRITDPSSIDNAINLSELSLANVDKIELVRGSHSTLYGSSAIGGVVNFITTKNMKQGFNANVNLRTGTFGDGTSDVSENILLNYTAGNGLYFSGEVYNTKVKGIDATVKNETGPEVFTNYDKDGFEKTDIIGKIGYATNKIDAFVSFKNTDQKLDIDDGAFNDDDNYTVDFKRALVNYSAKYSLNDSFDFTLNGGYTKMERETVDDSSVVDKLGNTDRTYSSGTYKGTVLNNELLSNMKFKYVDAIVGLGYYKETMNNKTFYYSDGAWGPYQSEQDLDTLDLNTETKNIFAYLDINGGLLSSVIKDLDLALGSRYNDHSTFGDEITYEINPSYKLTENTIIYGSYATGFNAPPLYRLFSPNKNFTSGITRGNSNLKPEYSKSIELGIKQNFDIVQFRLSAFSTEVENNIEYVYLWNKDIAIADLGNDFTRNDNMGDTYINLGRLNTKGFEVSVSSQILKNLSVNVNYSYVDGDLDYSPSDIDNEQTKGHHVQIYSNGSFVNKEVKEDKLVRRTNTANLSILYSPINKLGLNLNVKYVGKKDDILYDATLGPWGALGTLEISDYTLFDLSAKYQILQNLTATIKVENIFDKEYTEIRGYSTRGRGAYLSLTYNLK